MIRAATNPPRPVEFGGDDLFAALDLDGDLVHSAGAGEDELEVGAEVGELEEHELDVGRVDVDAADHDADPSERPVMREMRRKFGFAVPGSRLGQVVGAVADDRQGFLRQRGEDEFALFAVGQNLAV